MICSIFCKIQKHGLRNSLRWFISNAFIGKIVQQLRIFYYIILSDNKPKLNESRVFQPVQWCGFGSIYLNKVHLGFPKSPGFLNSSMYIEARSYQSKITIGAYTCINNNALIICNDSSIEIGSNCLIGCNFSVFDSDFHGIQVINRNNGNFPSIPVKINDNVFIGNNVTILKGVNIGINSIIGAGSVVTKDVNANSIYAGNPACFIRSLA